ncbi:hypothetical protein IMZ48_10455 [Candidatus Bathyarchaeota archaeon]|nr:hypothetical protein [Candidatus Bathyarchaeota archaeon]
MADFDKQVPAGAEEEARRQAWVAARQIPDLPPHDGFAALGAPLFGNPVPNNFPGATANNPMPVFDAFAGRGRGARARGRG